MGKKSSPSLTPLESLRKHSQILERHIYHKQQALIAETLHRHHTGISHATYELGTDLLREIKQEARLRPQQPDIDSDHDSEDIRRQIRERERLPNAFQEKLHHSQTSYQRCSAIFKAISLKQKYRHLCFPVSESESEEEKANGPSEELEEGEKSALVKIKQLYRRYRVSNMYKKHVCHKICRKYVERLIKKGFIQEHKTILSLMD